MLIVNSELRVIHVPHEEVVKREKGISHRNSEHTPSAILIYFPVENTSVPDPVSSLSGGVCVDLISLNPTKIKKKFIILILALIRYE